MHTLKHGKEEIVYLLTKAIEKYKEETGHKIVLNTNRKNYEVLAILLSAISNELPYKWKDYGTDEYTIDKNLTAQQYPYRKYDITGGQIKDALNSIVASPRSFLVDACYIYVYGIGRKLFDTNPMDKNLLVTKTDSLSFENNISNDVHLKNRIPDIVEILKKELTNNQLKVKWIGGLVIALIVILLSFVGYFFVKKSNWNTLKADMNILPYQPTKAEIDSIEGIWLCYTGSPQARISDPQRYHKVVSNLVQITYKNGYFTYDRWGASFNHTGYIQFESKGIVSIFSKIKNNSNTTQSPRHSLLNLYANKDYVAAMSASWNFDIGEKNKIIGIREIYAKQGKGGEIKEILNEIENASCKCKVIKWTKQNNEIQSYYLKNELLDDIKLPFLKPLINEKSILPNTPQDGLVLVKDSVESK